MALKNIFNVNDKVFAKLDDHPAWPAMVSCIKDKNSLKPKYVVNFYGTYAFAECLPEELFPYEKYKLEFVKQKKLSPFKRSQFIKGLKEIENDFVIPMFKKYVSTTQNDIKKKSNSRSKNELNKLSASTSEELNSPKRSIHISKNTDESAVDKQKEICKKQMSVKKKYSKNVKRILIKQPVVVLVRMPFPSKTIKHQNSKTSNVYGTVGQNYCTNKNDLRSSITTEHIQVAESIDCVEENNQTAKSMFENKKKNTSKIRKSQQSTNTNQENEIRTTEQSRPSLKSNKKNKQTPISIVSIEHNLNNNEIIKKCTIRKSGVKKTEPSRFGLRSNKNKQNFENASTMPTSNNNDSKKKGTDQNEYSDDETNNDKNVLIKKDIEDSELHEAGSSKSTMCSLPIKDVKTEEEISSLRNVSKINPSTLSNQTEIGQTRDQIQELTDLFQNSVVDAGSEVRMKKAQPEENNKSKIAKLQELKKVMDCIYEIRSALTVDNPNYKVTIKSLLQIKKSNLSHFMWTKHPDIVDTITKVSRYMGGIQGVQDQKSKEDIKNATQIRNIARQILVKIASLFNVSMQAFETEYWRVSNEFYDKFKDLDPKILHASTSEDQLISFL